MPELRQWQIVDNGRAKFAVGYLYNDPRINNGTWIRTARILLHDDSCVVTAAKSYLLGDPAP